MTVMTGSSAQMLGTRNQDVQGCTALMCFPSGAVPVWMVTIFFLSSCIIQSFRLVCVGDTGDVEELWTRRPRIFGLNQC